MRASIHHFALAILILYPLQVLASSVRKDDPDVTETDTSQASSSGQLVPQKRKTSKGDKMHEKTKDPVSTTLHDAPESGRETPVGRNSAPSPESEKTKGKENNGEASPPIGEGGFDLAPFAVSGSAIRRDIDCGFTWAEGSGIFRNMLGERTFRSDLLREKAAQMAFRRAQKDKESEPEGQKAGTADTSPSGQLVPRKSAQAPNLYEALIAEGDYKEIARLGMCMTEKEFIRDLCPLIITLDHYHGLGGVDGFMERRGLIPSFLVHGHMPLVRKIMTGDGVKREYLIDTRDGEGAFTLSFNNQNYERFIDLLAAEEQNHVESGRKGELLRIRYDTEIYTFYRKIDAVNNMQFKHFLLRYGEDLNGKYPITFKAVCGKLGSRMELEPEEFRDFLGQPFSFPPSAIIETFAATGLFISGTFLDVAPREAFEECLTEPRMEALGKDLWEKIVEKFRGTDPAFPPSRETREHVLSRFPTKHQMEMAWTKNKVPNYEAVIATKRKVLAAYISSLDIFPKVLVRLTIEYIPVTCSWFYLPAK